jgi:cytochrome P450
VVEGVSHGPWRISHPSPLLKNERKILKEERMAADNLNPVTGEINLLDAKFAACPQPVYAELLDQFRVATIAVLGAPLISRYEDVIWALRHPEIFSSAMDIHVALGTERPMIPLQVDPPTQTRYRKILDQRFSHKRSLELEPAVRRHANQLIDAVIDRGECEFGEAFAIPLPCLTFLSLMGLPHEDLELFTELKDGIIRPPVPGSDLVGAYEHRAKTGKRIYAYFEKVIDDRRAAPGDDIVSYLTTAVIDGDRLTRNEILDICYLFLLAGLDTVTATLGCNIAYLAAHPEQRRRCAQEPALLPQAIEELLRWETPVTTVPRVVKQDVMIGDVEIKEGTLVNLLLGAANVDHAEFADAQRVDFDRQQNRHVAFGGGPHRCLGSHLARMELRAALEEWHRRIPEYAIKPGETPRYSPSIREVRYLPLVWDVSQAAKGVR